MSEVDEQFSPPRSSDHPPSHSDCPGLDPAFEWDDPTALRGVMLTPERLYEHAEALARAHGDASLDPAAGRLRARIIEARKKISAAYANLAEGALHQHDPTPAEEWLLDNAHIVTEQLREIDEDLPWGYLKKLPRLTTGKMRGYPRVYGLCLDYLRHTEARLDLDGLARFVNAYQAVYPLRIGELWAIPIMLRLGLILVVGALATAETRAEDRIRAAKWATRLSAIRGNPPGLVAALAELNRNEEAINDGFLVQFSRELRERESLPGSVLDWIYGQSQRLGSTPDELARKHHLSRASDHVAVGNSITSMRAIAALDWNHFFEETSVVEAVLRRDPALAYEQTDETSRDRYRHAVEDIARRSPEDERTIASRAVELAAAELAQSPKYLREAHVGYYLVDEGRRKLEASVRYRPSFVERITRSVKKRPEAYYFTAVALLTLALLWGAGELARSVGIESRLAMIVFGLLSVVPASEVALGLVQTIVVAVLPPRLLSKLAYDDGLAEEARTLVAVPTLIDSPDTARALLAHLEVRSLANPDPNLHFALLSDFDDADAAEKPSDAAIVRTLREGVAELCARAKQPNRFLVFHRHRVKNDADQRFMGWERKRGKLEELNRVLRGESGSTFDGVTAPPELLSKIRYVITLDTDTELPRDAARALVGTIAHPLNQAELGASQRVERGYGFIQPRVGTLPGSSRQSRFARLTAGPPGIDPYTTAVSDVYQDLFGRGSFIGKAIYDVDAVKTILEGRVPENALLSHDLFEGELAHTALATDIELFDDHPATYATAAARQHRWIRGDWQLLPFLFPRVPTSGGGKRPNELSALAWWKLFDNLRRSALAPILVVLAACGFALVPAAAAYVLATIGIVFAAPLLVRVVMSLARHHDKRTPVLHGVIGDLRTSTAQIAIRTVFLLDQAVITVDAIARTLYRVFISKRNLLEWQTAGRAARQFGNRQPPRLYVTATLAVLWLVVTAFVSPAALPWALPILLCWAGAPFIAAWLGRPLPQGRPAVSAADEAVFRSTARKTWRFFETFVTAEENHLPPDNYQQDPLGVVAHRTSPTNIGLYLLSVVSARDLRYLTLAETEQRLSKTLATIDRLEKRNGHVLNWYDTTTLRPLDPPYVSMVDSGNLAGYLWTLRQACSDLVEAPVLDASAWDACRDALRLARATTGLSAGPARRVLDTEQRIERLRPSAGVGVGEALSLAGQTLAILAETHGDGAGEQPEDFTSWMAVAQRDFAAAVSEARALAPFAEVLRQQPGELSSEPFSGSWTGISTVLSAAKSPSSIAAAARAAIPLIDGLEAAFETSPGDSDEAALFLARLRGLLSQAQAACIALTRSLNTIGEHAETLVESMNFNFLYDEGRALFSIGFNAANSRLDGSHYDLLASEARLGSLVAIAKGDVPQEHWFRLGRALTGVRGGRALLSWSGSMFEYLMPLLVTRNGDGTLLHETYETAVLCQRDYGAQKSTPWGVSESAYNVMDLGLTYQYRAFGVPGLGLKTGLGEDFVVAPYATALAAMVSPHLAASNFRALSREGLEGVYGYFESVDYTPMRVPPGRSGVIVKTYMAHHQGMTLVSLANVLLGDRMPDRFHRDPRIIATELLLEERVPLVGPLVELRPTIAPLHSLASSEADIVERVPLQTEGPLRAHVLGHGDISTLVTSLGSGVTMWKGMDVNRHREDVVDGGGIFVYVRDVASGPAWSAGYEPTRREPDAYDAAFSADRVSLRRRDGDVETSLEIVVSPEHPADVRRITLTNHGRKARELEITTYMEVVLAPRGADRAHRAFGNMFVETSSLEDRGALLARRKTRGAGEKETWLVQVLTPEKGEFSRVEFETSRVRFIGRGRDLTHPIALEPGSKLGGSLGAVLDPVLVLRRRVVIAPDETASLALMTVLAAAREEAVELAATYSAQETISRTFELGWADAHVELRHLGIGSGQSHRFQRLLSAIVFPDPALRAPASGVARVGRGKNSLFAHGISGDLPILVLAIDDPDFADLCRELLLAQEFWRLNGIEVDLVLLNEEPMGYLQPMQDGLVELVRASHARGRVDQRGGVYVRRLDNLSGGDADVLLRTARVVLAASKGSLSRQLRRGLAGRAAVRAVPVAVRHGSRVPSPVPVVRPKLTFDNGIGGFDAKTHEYVMVIGPGTQTPAPWCNVVGYADFGFLISESGSSCTWRGNSQTGRLTPWNNDAVLDPSGETIYLRDEATGAIWSATPKPAGGDAEYLVRHGFGVSTFEHERGGVRHELAVTADPDRPLKVYRLRLENRGPSVQRLTIFGLVDWVLGDHRERTRLSLSTQWDAKTRSILAVNAFSSVAERCAFFSTTHAAKSFTADRNEFFGLNGSREHPRALERASLSGRTGSGLDPCGAIQVAVSLQPHEKIEVAFLLGEGDDIEHAIRLAQVASDHIAVEGIFERSRQHFEHFLQAVSVRTPSPSMDLMLNGWLLYQALSCRILARSAFYQSSGAYGFRDQLQDVLALIHVAPELVREHLLRAAARQFEEGDVQHWWHPDTGEGVRTRYSDDLLWLPYVTAEYVRMTGDQAVCDEQVPFLRDRTLGDDEHEHYGRPSHGGATASLYEHCTRALDKGTTQGAHGLPLMGGGDWNDGMNRVGEGGGESVWLAWLLGRTLDCFRPLALVRGDEARAAACLAEHQRLSRAVEETAWDGRWYRRAYFADGTALGSSESPQCRIDAIAQSWAAISRMGDPARAEMALDSAEAELVHEEDGFMALLSPPFTQRGDHDPGYIAAYPTGIRENGGQYTHGVLWSVLARTELGHGERAEALYRLMNPIHHAETSEDVASYVVEPYVVAADVYAHPDHMGRGGWTWYTGSAAWMYRIGLENILGIRLDGGTLSISPCIPPAWQGYEIEYRHGSSRYRIAIENPYHVSHGVVRVDLDGKLLPDGRIPLEDDGRTHRVRITLGQVRQPLSSAPDSLRPASGGNLDLGHLRGS